MSRPPARQRRRCVECATPRQVDVAQAWLDAGSDKGAAYVLGLSERTIENHLANARARCGVVNNGQLVALLGLRLTERRA